MENPNLASAYAAARRHVPAFARHGFRVPSYRGRDYSSDSDGIGAAVYAIRDARARLCRYADARARYEESHAIRDARREESNAAKRAAQSLAAEGGPRYEAAAQAVTAAEGELSHAERMADKARREVSAARVACYAPGGDYGAGTWQGGDGSAVPSALPFALPPAMRNGRNGWTHIARHMRPGDKGGQFFAEYEGGPVRNVRDAGDVARLGHTGWYDNPHGESFRDGSGLILGIVGQLRGRDGRAVFVPGWRMGDDCQGGATFDLRAAVTAEGREESDAEEAAEDCARIADSMAESVAESEREYKTAWGAGAAWADLGERLAAIRAEVRQALRENRESGGSRDLPAFDSFLRSAIGQKLAERAEIMAERERLADGDESPFIFYPDADARAAFCEGADVSRFPG